MYGKVKINIEIKCKRKSSASQQHLMKSSNNTEIHYDRCWHCDAGCLSCLLCLFFHPACLARVVSWFSFVAAIFIAHENGDEQRQAKRRHVQGMLDKTDPLRIF